MLVLVLSCASSISAFFPDKPRFNASMCPGWLNSYIQFHKENKHASGAKYLTYLGFFAGLGDRMRGLLFTFRVASASRRIFIISTHLHYALPIQLGDFFMPAEIDWTPPNKTVVNWDPDSWRVKETWGASESVRPDPPAAWLRLGLSNGTFIEMMQQEKFVAFVTNEKFHWDMPGVPPVALYSLESHCIFHALFKPTGAVMDRMLNLSEKMGISLSKPYTAVHLRLGGQVRCCIIHASSTHNMHKFVGRLERNTKSTLLYLRVGTFVWNMFSPVSSAPSTWDGQ